MSLESAALKSLDQIAALSADNRALAAENRRLREAGDALAKALLECADGPHHRFLCADWHTATGGTR